MSFAFNFPEIILTEVLKDWSNLVEIARMGSAVLNFKERSEFLRIIESKEFSIPSNVIQTLAQNSPNLERVIFSKRRSCI